MTDNEKYLADMRERVQSGWAKQALRATSNGLDKYPQDVIDILAEFCRLWSFRAPQLKDRKAFWIKEARNLQEACGAKWKEVLQSLHQDWQANNYPYTVSSPKSLVNMAVAKEAEMRLPKRVDLSDIPDHLRKA